LTENARPKDGGIVIKGWQVQGRKWKDKNAISKMRDWKMRDWKM